MRNLRHVVQEALGCLESMAIGATPQTNLSLAAGRSLASRTLLEALKGNQKKNRLVFLVGVP